jgi:hypothetical protein
LRFDDHGLNGIHDVCGLLVVCCLPHVVLDVIYLFHLLIVYH